MVAALPESSRLLILSPLVRGRKGTHQAVLEEIRKTGFVRTRVDGVVHELDEDIQMDRYKIHNIEAVVDRVLLHHDPDPEEDKLFLSRLTDSIETALKFGDGYLIVQDITDAKAPFDMHFSEHLACPEHGSVLPEIEPRTFSFNTPHGACPDCQGLGGKLEIDAELLIPDPDLSLTDGAIISTEWSGPKEEGGYYWQSLEAAAKYYDIDLKAPVRDLPKEKLDIVLFGTHGKEIPITYKRDEGHQYVFDREFEGVISNLMRRYNETNSEYMREKISVFMRMRTCPTCGGKRLRREAIAVTVDGKNIVEITDWPILQTLRWIENLCGSSTPLNSRQQTIAERILKEISERLGFLVDVGLDYLTLKRSAGSLSGGEAQRIRLATQIGSRLMGVLYVLDEPSIGLHPRDNTRLLRTLKGLRDLGNSVIVVEHDSETILSADWVLDLGPGAGEHGGKVVAEGTVEQILENPDSLTGAYLSGRLQVDVPRERRTGNGKKLTIVGARENNLKNINVNVPLGKFVCITGVSGSGKSTLMIEILYKALAARLQGAHTQPGDFDRIDGIEYVDKVINIDQQPDRAHPTFQSRHLHQPV